MVSRRVVLCQGRGRVVRVGGEDKHNQVGPLCNLAGRPLFMFGRHLRSGCAVVMVMCNSGM